MESADSVKGLAGMDHCGQASNNSMQLTALRAAADAGR